MPHPVLKPDGSVVFESSEAVQEHFDTYLSKGSAMVRPERRPDPFATLAVYFVGPSGARVDAKAQAVAFPGHEVLLQLLDFGPPLVAQLMALTAPASAPPPSAPGSREAHPDETRPSEVGTTRRSAILRLNIAPTGSFKNPDTPERFLELPLSHAPTRQQVSTPSVPLVFMAVVAKKEPCVRLVVRGSGNRVAELSVLDGTRVLLGMPERSILTALAEPSGTYEIASQAAPPPNHRYKAVPVTLLYELVKDLVKRYVEPDLRAGLAGRMGQSPKLGPTGEQVLRRVNVSDAQTRVGKRMLTGEYALDEVLYTGIGVRSTFQLLYLMEVWGGLSWVDPPPKENLLVDELRETLARAQSADHFAVMGLHLSTPPRQIEKTLHRLRGMYGPGGTIARASPELSAELWTKIQAAYQVISTADGRKRYRAERFPTVRLDYAADLTLAQAELAELRSDWELAIDLLEITLELHPTREALEEMRRVQDLKAGRRQGAGRTPAPQP